MPIDHDMATSFDYQKFKLLVEVSRVASWCFGPVLYLIGIIHARTRPVTLPDILATSFQILCLSFPLCISGLLLY